MIKGGLSCISQINTNGSYAYTKLNLAEKDLKELLDPLKNYIHLRHLDISNNASLADISLITNLRFLCYLNASKIALTSLDVFNPYIFDNYNYFCILLFFYQYQ